MEIVLAANAGYCYGVRLAVNTALENAKKYGHIYTLGDIIHNKNVISVLQKAGIKTVYDITDIPDNETVMIRAHGVKKDDIERLKDKHCRIIDGTCPNVKKIHKIVEEESAKCRKIIIAGKREHPEVIGIASRCGVCRIAEDTDSLEKVCHEWSDEHLSVVAQTTFQKKLYEIFKNLIKSTCNNVQIFDTICSATELRQEEAASSSALADAALIVGDKSSSNTNNLFAICSENCPNTQFVESADQIDFQSLKSAKTVFITAGASTPNEIIEEVYRKMTDEVKNVEAESFEELLEQSFKTLHTGDKVTGTVTSINNTDITVDLGVKQAGYIPMTELSDDPNFNLAESIKIGDTVDAYVIRVNDVDGVITLSKRRLDAGKNWEKLEAAVESKESFDGIVVEQNKGGIVAMVLGIKVFIPASQTGLPKDASFDTLLKSKQKIRITEVNKARRRVVGSIKAPMNDARREARAKIWDEIEVGKKYKGVVKSFTSYGAFIDIGGVDGMIHISELSWGRVNHPSDVLKIGQTIDTYVISLDQEKHKISLSYRDPADDPWVSFVNNYHVDDIVPVKIVKFMPFGAFAEITENIDGLIHISQIADHRIDKPEQVLKLGSTVDAKIIAIDQEKKKISLSIRAIADPSAVPLKTEETAVLEAKPEEEQSQPSPEAPTAE